MSLPLVSGSRRYKAIRHTHGGRTKSSGTVYESIVSYSGSVIRVKMKARK
jgi:hypothetical protein